MEVLTNLKGGDYVEIVTANVVEMRNNEIFIGEEGPFPLLSTRLLRNSLEGWQSKGDMTKISKSSFVHGLGTLEHVSLYHCIGRAIICSVVPQSVMIFRESFTPP